MAMSLKSSGPLVTGSLSERRSFCPVSRPVSANVSVKSSGFRRRGNLLKSCAATDKESANVAPSAKPVVAEVASGEPELAEGNYTELIAYVGASILFGIGIFFNMGPAAGQEFFAGYLLEQSLSIDNLFVFILVFKFFKTPADIEPKILTYGIVSAAVLRAIMVLVGAELIENFKPILGVFAAILLYSSYNLLSSGDEDDDEEDLSDNSIVQFCQKFIKSTDKYDGDNFFTLAEDGITKIATPMLLTCAVVELSDVVFAVDSIPAVFGVTKDPFIVYTSNMFAILSLRSLFFFVSNVMSQLKYLDKSVAIVLGFVGGKMLFELAGFEIGTDVSLGVVCAVLAAGVGASLFLDDGKKEPSA